jgi:hypothetical protein
MRLVPGVAGSIQSLTAPAQIGWGCLMRLDPATPGSIQSMMSCPDWDGLPNAGSPGSCRVYSVAYITHPDWDGLPNAASPGNPRVYSVDDVMSQLGWIA